MKKIILTIIVISTLIFGSNISAVAQAVNKPSIMVFPDDIWMNSNGFLKEVDNQGVKSMVPDYTKALLNEELGQVITKIEKMMLDRGYPLENLSQTLKSLQDAEAIKSMETSEDGNSVQVSLKDKLLNSARPDLILYVSWKVNTIGPKKSVYFSMKAVDAGTNKPAGAADGTGNELIGATLGVMLETAVLSHIDNFNSQLMTYFDEMVAKGREVSVEIQVFENSPKKLNSEINDDGDELSDDIQKWMKANTVNGAFTIQTKSSTLMKMTSVRIPLRNEDGTAFNADEFGTKLRKYIRKTYQLSCSSYPVGTGKAVVVIGGKSQ
jgi:DNA-binding transcriptional ArsR family regulator